MIKFMIFLFVIGINFTHADDPDGWASSLHLGFRDQSDQRADLLMTDVMVDSSSPNTYYAFINFTGGYSGFQQHDGHRTVHFSLWDFVDGDAQTVPYEKAAKIVWCGYHVNGSGFGNEGTGVKTSAVYDWKLNRPYRVAIKFRHGKYDTLDGAYRDYWIYDFEEQDWMHMATLWRADDGMEKEYAGEVYTFVEDWAATGEWFRSCYVYNARKKYYASNQWKVYEKVHYSINDDETESPGPHDPNTQAEIRDGHKIWLATGGDFTPDDRNPSGTTFNFTPNPDIDEPQSPGLTNIRVENIDDSTMQVNWEYEKNKWAAQESFEIRIYSDRSMNNTVYKTGTMYPHDYDPFPLRPKDNRFYKLSHRSYKIKGLELDPDQKYYLRLITRTIFGYNSWNWDPIVIQNYTPVDSGEPFKPHKFRITSVYPNPFNIRTKIQYEIPKTSKVELSIYNLLGEEIRTLYKGTQNSGLKNLTWNGRNDKGQIVQSGIYLCVLKNNNKTRVKKITLVK